MVTPPVGAMHASADKTVSLYHDRSLYRSRLEFNQSVTELPRPCNQLRMKCGICGLHGEAVAGLEVLHSQADLDNRHGAAHPLTVQFGLRHN